MNIGSVHHATAPGLEAVPLESLAHNQALTEEQKVEEASRQFEAVILRQILAQGRKAVIHSKYNDESTTSGIYQDMVTSQLADAISRSGSFGLARSLQTQLTHPTGEAPSPSPRPKT